MVPLSATLISLCAEKFLVAPEDAGAALGSEQNILSILKTAGFKDIQASLSPPTEALTPGLVIMGESHAE